MNNALAYLVFWPFIGNRFLFLGLINLGFVDLRGRYDLFPRHHPAELFNHEVRRHPVIIIEPLSHAGVTFSKLLMAVVGVIVTDLGATGLAQDFVILIDQLSDGRLFITLLVSSIAALMLGMGIQLS